MVRSDLYQFWIVSVLVRKKILLYLRLYLHTVGAQEERTMVSNNIAAIQYA
jgi:hypothetical protein